MKYRLLFAISGSVKGFMEAAGEEEAIAAIDRSE